MKLSASSVCKSLGLPAPKKEVFFQRISADSREVQAGELFVALPGEKFDGHSFIPQVLQKGVRAILTHQPPPANVPEDAVFFQVPDTLNAYRTLGAAWLKLARAPLVLVAGSVGKTTTKELLAALLEGKFPKEVLKTQGSENGFVGIPKTLLKLHAAHKAIVLEVGIDAIGAMEQHLKLVSPTAAVVTAIEAEHLEFLKDIPTVAHEECVALFKTHQAGGKVVLNWDDAWVTKVAAPLLNDSNAIAFSVAEKPKTKNWVYGKVKADLVQMESNLFGTSQFTLPLPGLHNARNFVAAFALAKTLGLTDTEIAQGLKTFQPTEGRSQLRKLQTGALAAKNIQVLCDYYNASPASTTAGIALLSEIAERSKTPSWACLADMLELGDGEETFHRQLCEPLLNANVAHVLLFGKRMRWLEDELKSKGFRGELRHFEDKNALSQHLLQKLQPGEVVLLKGSRSMKMEEVWKALQA